MRSLSELQIKNYKLRIRNSKCGMGNADCGVGFHPPFSIFYLLFTVLVISSAYGQNAATQPDILNEIGIEQKLDGQIPLDLKFTNEQGRQVALADYFGKKPVVLSLVYYECPMLCSMILNGLLASLKPLKFDVGAEFDVVTLSFDPRETPELAAEKKQSYLKQYDREGAADGWHFLTGEEEQIRQLTEAAGFNYKFDETTGQYVHASAIMILTPEGKLSRYFYGVEYPSKNLRLGLIEASDNVIGSPVDQVLLYCYHYDPTTGKYGLVIMNVIRLLGTITVILLVGFIITMLLRDRRAKSVKRGARSAESSGY